MATQLGPNGEAQTAGPGGSLSDLGFNFALNVSLGTTVPAGSVVSAVGIGNIAVNLFGNGTAVTGHRVEAVGTLSSAMAVGGTNNQVYASTTGGALNLGFTILGSGNQVYAGPGPVAVAGSILQNGQTVKKMGPGFNINGIVVGGAAATPPTGATNRRPTTPTAAAGTHSRAGGVASAAAKRNAAR
jgi:hypothetical protein